MLGTQSITVKCSEIGQAPLLAESSIPPRIIERMNMIKCIWLSFDAFGSFKTAITLFRVDICQFFLGMEKTNWSLHDEM